MRSYSSTSPPRQPPSRLPDMTRRHVRINLGNLRRAVAQQLRKRHDIGAVHDVVRAKGVSGGMRDDAPINPGVPTGGFEPAPVILQIEPAALRFHR